MKNTSLNSTGSKNTELPKTLMGRQRKAEAYLDLFSQWTSYKHRGLNPYLKWLKSGPNLKPDAIYRFFNFWWPISRHQPQILWKIGSIYPDWSDRNYVMKNLIEEDGHVKAGDNPHYDLLTNLIVDIGGRLDVDEDAEKLVGEFHESLNLISPAEATGILASIEHPALDISEYFTIITTLCGYPELLTSDPYLYIHIDVEPNHLIWSHGNALDWMDDTKKMQRLGYRKEDVINAFSHGTNFWEEYWAKAFAKLGYK